jgi:excinuclease ABC subunit A
MPLDHIIVKGAREHNLKNIDLVIPRNQLVVITGVSGSGKSSLAFDTIYAEGQRRYVESLSAYARQFLGRIEKPDVDYIEGLSPSISIDQKGVSRNPRSTVGTVTEIYDYLRLLYARVGKPHCYKCGRPVQRQSVPQIVDAILTLPNKTRIMVLAPVARDRKGEFKDIFEDAVQKGFVRVRVDGQIRDLSDGVELDKKYRHTIEVVVDRLMVSETLDQSRVHDSVETALRLADGIVSVSVEGEPDTTPGQVSPPKNLSTRKRTSTDGRTIIFSERFSCPYCGISVGEIEPRNFSFNTPHGACPDCSGLGYKLVPDPDLVIPNKDLALSDGAVVAWVRTGRAAGWYHHLLRSLAKTHGFSTQTPVRELSSEILQLILYGDMGRSMDMNLQTRRGHTHRLRTSFEGVIPNLIRRYRDVESDHIREDIERYMARHPCSACEGRRLNPEAMAVTVCGQNIMQVCARTIERTVKWVDEISKEESDLVKKGEALSPRDKQIADQVLKEIRARLRFLLDVGLEYLSLDRGAATLSGGEGQRIRLATQIGSGLMGVLYVCDEPTIGLHPADDSRLINTLQKLRDLGNTVLIVEHDEAMMQAADHIVDLGPGAGESGGYVVAVGPLSEILASPQSITGAYLSGRRIIPIPTRRRVGIGSNLRIEGARANNLKKLDVDFPLGCFVCVTGVSGSGKSSLVYEVLYKKLAQTLYRAKDKPGDHDVILGIEELDKVINIDQSPIGRTPRSNPATYIGAFTPIRELYSQLPEARIRGYKPGRFSFNIKGGRCEACQGAGYIQIEMQFLPDVTVPCELCKGMRYNREALEVRFHDQSIADVLNMTVDQALELFNDIPKIRIKLETIRDVGLGYIRLGQPATTLSGGEAQRVKLSTELSRRATGRTLYMLDEPTTGLSFEDVAALLRVLHRLVESGNTIIVIEHHMDVVKNADWLIDLGPGAGDRGGELVAVGTPEKIAKMANSVTGQYLQAHLQLRETKALKKATRPRNQAATVG